MQQQPDFFLQILEKFNVSWCAIWSDLYFLENLGFSRIKIVEVLKHMSKTGFLRCTMQESTLPELLAPGDFQITEEGKMFLTLVRVAKIINDGICAHTVSMEE